MQFLRYISTFQIWIPKTREFHSEIIYLKGDALMKYKHGTVWRWVILENLRQNQCKPRLEWNHLYIYIYKNHENFKNSKPRVQFYWFSKKNRVYTFALKFWEIHSWESIESQNLTKSNNFDWVNISFSFFRTLIVSSFCLITYKISIE